MEFNHVSVLLKETVDQLSIKPNGIYVDGTLGGGGHSYYLASQLDKGLLIGIDQDHDALAAATERLEEYSSVFKAVHANFEELIDVLDREGIDEIDGMLIDLGVSSYQLDEAERGFSYMHDGELDMRMNRQQALSAYEVVNEYSEDELNRIIKDYGEERWAKRIAKFIVEKRSESPIKSTYELVDVIKAAIPKKARMDGPHPAKRTFQAIRIEVNNELGIIEKTIEDCVSRLKPGGRMSIITFHSLEDRIVKQTFKRLATGCVCPKEFPVCTCGQEPIVKLITRKPMLPSAEELEHNPRARSAKLRVCEKR